LPEREIAVNVHTQKSIMQGPVGAIELAQDAPTQAVKGVVVIAHPHPLFGGTMDNKVVQTLARAFTQCGWTAVRFNFRGVGDSAGVHDDGRGELDDFLAVVRHAAPSGRLALAGFSFGGFVTSNAFAQLHTEREIDSLVLVGVATSRFPVSPIPAEAHVKTLVIHGEQDDTVPLAAVMDWARPQILPVTVVPGVGHFFHGQLPLLKSLVVRHLG
jgi:alpha/beta superfamily hydrolase